MAIRSGIDAQIGYAAETTYGTYVEPDTFVEFTTEGLKAEHERVESSAIRPGRRVTSTARWKVNQKGASGDVEHEVASKGFGLLFEHMLGDRAITTPGGATNSRLHTCTLADPWGKSLTVQVGRPDVGGTVQPFTYLGAKVTEWEMAMEVDGFLTVKPTFDAREEVTSETLAADSYAASDELLVYTGASLTIAGSAVDVRKVSLKGTNGVKTDRHFIGEPRKKQPIAAEWAELTGEVELEFENLTAYNRFINGTVAALVFTAEGSQIESGHNYGVTVTLPAVRFDGDTPNVGGMDVLTLTLPFKALDDGSNPPITLAYKTTDTA